MAGPLRLGRARWWRGAAGGTEGVAHRAPLGTKAAPSSATPSASGCSTCCVDDGRPGDHRLTDHDRPSVGLRLVRQPGRARAILAAAAACPAHVRSLSGDYHAARWAQLGPRVAERARRRWPSSAAGARALPDVADHGYFTVGNFRSRPEALAVLTLDEFNAATTSGAW